MRLEDGHDIHSAYCAVMRSFELTNMLILPDQLREQAIRVLALDNSNFEEDLRRLHNEQPSLVKAAFIQLLVQKRLAVVGQQTFALPEKGGFQARVYSCQAPTKELLSQLLFSQSGVEFLSFKKRDEGLKYLPDGDVIL